jgi:hypothetical protein
MEQESQAGESLSAETRAALAQTSLKYRRRIELEPVPNYGARASFTLGEHGAPDRLRFNPSYRDHLDHLVLHELGHAALNYEAGPNDRLRASIDYAAVSQDIDREASRLYGWLPRKRIDEWERSAAWRIVQSLTSHPQDSIIERTIAENPAVRGIQERSLRQQAAELDASVATVLRGESPEKARRANLALDGAWVSWVARHLHDPGLASRVASSPAAKDAAFVLGVLDSVKTRALPDCRAAADRIAEHLGVRSWYTWRQLAI